MKKWLIAVLTLAWLAWELVAAFDHDPHTWPLTQVIVTYVPAWIYMPAALLLAVWLPWHLWSNRQRGAAQEVAMSNQLVHLDAVNRAARTFIQGLLVDVLGAVVLVLTTQLGDLQWTKTYWAALGLLLMKTAISAGVAYVYRRVRPPAVPAISSKTL